MKNPFGNKLVNELRKYNKYGDTNIQFVRNLRKLGFSNAKISEKAGYSIKELNDKIHNKEFSSEITNKLAPFVTTLVEILNEKIEPVRTPRGKFKQTSVRSSVNAKAAFFWMSLVTYEYNLTHGE